jgi:hypothetical protein
VGLKKAPSLKRPEENDTNSFYCRTGGFNHRLQGLRFPVLVQAAVS